MVNNEREVILQVKNLKQYFRLGRKGIVKAVDDVSFDIYKGETFGLVGESGSGKTTTGRSIIRLYNPTAGHVHFNGLRVDGKMTNSKKKALAKNMQMIFQDPQASLNGRMTVGDIIAEGLDVHGLYATKEERMEKVYNMLEVVGLNREHASRYPHEFSGGQRQRIGVARALIIEPKFIVADEPISALDVSIQAQVVNLMNELKKDRDLTYLFIAHDLSMVKYISDRVAVMHKGKIVELADSEKLYNHPLHPYTKSLLSAIPLPDPRSERTRRRVPYDPSIHNYSKDNMPSWVEVEDKHWVYGSESELEDYRKQLKA